MPAPDAAFRFLAGLGYTEGAQAFDPLQKVNLAMRHHAAMPDVEVIWPGDGPSPIDHKPTAVRQQNRTADLTHGQKQPVECALRHAE